MCLASRQALPNYYRFESLGARSAIGRTRTLPREGVSRLRLGVVSCSNLPQGYFNAYACLARRADLDAILHLGDYIYEYPNKGYGDGTALGRIPSPDKEMVALHDQRAIRAGLCHRERPEPPDGGRHAGAGSSGTRPRTLAP